MINDGCNKTIFGKFENFIHVNFTPCVHDLWQTMFLIIFVVL